LGEKEEEEGRKDKIARWRYLLSGLVKLNYSGSWSVRDVWESGGWEPRPDQLTWQQYELAATLYKVRLIYLLTSVRDP
jgi:hypothetical protein